MLNAKERERIVATLPVPKGIERRDEPAWRRLVSRMMNPASGRSVDQAVWDATNWYTEAWQVLGAPDEFTLSALSAKAMRCG